MRNPARPSEREVAEHNISHFPFRDWCPHCIRGRGLNQQHRQGKKCAENRDIPVIGMDYGFLVKKKGEYGHEEDVEGQKNDGRKIEPMLVMKDSKYGGMKSFLVPSKGISEPWVVKKCIQWIDFVGANRIVLKVDQEKSIVALAKEVKIARGQGAETAIEHPEAGESQSHGMTERAVGVAEGLVRTYLHALEARIGGSIDSRFAVFRWLVEHAHNVHLVQGGEGWPHSI